MALVTKREAKKMGRQRGIAAASWMFDGNTTPETANRFLIGEDIGDSLVLDQYTSPSWLSGEWAGESAVEILGEPDQPGHGVMPSDEDRWQDIQDTYCEAAERAYWRELHRLAKHHAS